MDGRSILAALLLPLTLSANLHTSTQELCQGFAPENDMQIPVNAFNAAGITEQEFNQVLDKIDNYFSPIVIARGGELKINRLWKNATVNASAQRTGNTYVINMYGGLARHSAITVDGFLTVACHEMGHHLGGAPKNVDYFSTWASVEGQSDYYATMRCLKALFDSNETRSIVENSTIDPVAREKCEQAWSTQEEELACMRISLASASVSALLADLRKEQSLPKFDTPDPRMVNRTIDYHPATQCRLDTYFQASLCVYHQDMPLDDSNPKKGTCNESENHPYGWRPRCWYKP